MTLVVTFRGPAQDTTFITLVFPSAEEARFPFQVVHFCVVGFQGGFLCYLQLLTVHVYSED